MIESTASIQDYLKVIYSLTAAEGVASTTAMAGQLGVAPASVTGMIQKLAASQPPLVIYKKHQGVTLTTDGERTALEVIRHHRLLETYLVIALGYSWDNVHDEACRLEHVISEEFEARIAAVLGNPSRDPHGDPIPTVDLSMPASADQPLSSLRPDQAAVVRRVTALPALLRHVEGLGLVPGVHLIVRAWSEFDHNLTIEAQNQAPVVLGFAVTSQIFVEVL